MSGGGTRPPRAWAFTNNAGEALGKGGGAMAELTAEQVAAMAAALGLPVTADDIAEVTHRLNALLEALAPLADLPLDTVEPVPVLPDEPRPS